VFSKSEADGSVHRAPLIPGIERYPLVRSDSDELAIFHYNRNDNNLKDYNRKFNQSLALNETKMVPWERYNLKDN